MKKNKILLGLGSTLTMSVLPLTMISCDWWNRMFNPNNQLKPKFPTPNNPNGNTGSENIPAQKDGYILYKSSNENYLKKNNNYYFKELTYKPQILNDAVYNNQGWKEYRPKMWMAIKEADNIIARFEALGVHLSSEKDYTNDFESACGIWNIIRTFANSDTTKRGVNNGGHFGARDGESKYTALIRFLNEMDEYLDRDVAFKGLCDNDYTFIEVMEKIKEDKNWLKTKLIYSASSDMPSSYVKKNHLDSLLEQIKKEGKDPFVYHLLEQYHQAAYEGWYEISDARNWFVAPYSFGSNDFMNIKFPNEQYNMYSHEKGLDATDNNQSYNNYNPLAFSFHQMARFYLSEKLNFEVYKNLIKWFKAFNRINPEKKKKWSEIQNKNNLKNASINLARALVQFLDWHHLLLAEFETPNDKTTTVADLFAMKWCDDNKIDFEYTYKFAYEFLYEKVVPTMIANGWSMPDEFHNFERNLIDTNRKDSYIYDYIFKYLNVIFKDKFPDINLLEKRKTYLNTSVKDFWKQKFLDNVLKHWNYQFEIDVKTNEF